MDANANLLDTFYNNNMKKLHYVLMAVAVAGSPAFARQLTPDEALEAARMAPAASKMMKANAALDLVYTLQNDGFKSCYVFNRANEQGYVVLAADDAVVPVLGYADHGSFDPQNIPDNMMWLLNSYKQQIAYAVQNPKAASMAMANNAPQEWEPVEPICTTLWDQGAPYNELCPVVNGERAVTGCVATAIAQVMKVHNWPAKGQGSHSYTFSREGVTMTLSSDFSQHTYDWANMLNSYPEGGYDQTQVDAVALLMSDCGIASNMSYGSTSGAITPRAAGGMIEYFNYNKGMKWVSRQTVYLTQWNKMVYDEVKAGRPVLLSGQNPEGGHAFVCDGYRDSNYFHINWGWSGISDGYFLLTLLDPFEQGSGGTSGGYTGSLAGLFGCQPAQAGAEIVPSISNTGGLYLARNSYNRNSSVTIGGSEYTTFLSNTLAPLTAKIGVELQNVATGELSYVWANGGFNNSLAGAGVFSYTLNGTKFPSSGTYIMKSVFQCNGKVYPVAMDVTGPLAQKLECTSTRLNFTPVYAEGETKITKFDDFGGFALGQPAVFTTTIETTTPEFWAEVTPQLLDANGSVIATAAAQTVDVVPDQPTVINWFANFPQANLTAGTTYTLALKVLSTETTLGQYQVKVLPNPGATAYDAPKFTVSGPDIVSGRWSQTTPAVIDRNSNVTVSINVTSGQFAKPIRLAWGNHMGVLQGETDNVILVGRKGEVVSHTFVAPFAYLPDPYRYYCIMLMSVNDNGADERISNYGAAQRIWFKLTGEYVGGVNDINSDAADNVALYPNPVVNDFTVQGNAIADVKVYSIAGALVLAADGNGDDLLSIDASKLASGHYIVMVNTADGMVAKRMIKQ